MNSNVFHLSIDEIKNTKTQWQHRLVPPNHLHYCPASAGGWGIIRVGLLVPESVMLFVSPAGCGRHGAIAGIQLGFKKPLFLLHVSEMDIITGKHMEMIPRAVDEIMATVRPSPNAMLICATCIDDLLGSDYDGLTQQLESRYGIPVRICHMNPPVMDTKKPPTFTVQQTVYDFLERSNFKERALNIIGSFAPIDAESEFYKVMADAGFTKVRHVAACKTMEEFRSMSKSTHNLLIKPGGYLAAELMKEKLQIPYCITPVTYSFNSIAQTYSALEKFLGVKLSTDWYCEEAWDTVKSYKKTLGALTVAVGSTANASPFELARALTEYGFHVPYIFADLLLVSDDEHIDWLKIYNPNVKIFTNNHPTMANLIKDKLTVDLTVGFDAGYFCSGAKTVPLGLEKQPYGYQGIIYLFREMVKALENPRNHKEQMYASGMVI
ncbi:MAG: nitrogenase component 1 [Proteobacteria bacterium]|nr:nitrogenase component 1 [Pseudomonadota bacterium]